MKADGLNMNGLQVKGYANDQQVSMRDGCRSVVSMLDDGGFRTNDDSCDNGRSGTRYHAVNLDIGHGHAIEG
ncbi:hypothetical protein [Rhizobium sp. P38BS-XIX]|uniref:hypothetical protein n=1 Tax=Rhizobium sp. P38BS-XIX TaxID=2726740 RepID=UPI001FEE7B0D|nr:hypothetical protein [Rhizobium sp. P38BS-XIX]